METYGTKAVAEMLGELQSTVADWCRKGKFPNAEQDKPGSPWRIPEGDVEMLKKKLGIKEK